MPSEQLSKLKEEKRIRNVNRRRAGLPEEEPLVDPRVKRQGPLGGDKGELAETILNEIEERRKHLEDMESLGIKSNNERIIAMVCLPSSVSLSLPPSVCLSLFQLTCILTPSS